MTCSPAMCVPKTHPPSSGDETVPANDATHDTEPIFGLHLLNAGQVIALDTGGEMASICSASCFIGNGLKPYSFVYGLHSHDPLGPLPGRRHRRRHDGLPRLEPLIRLYQRLSPPSTTRLVPVTKAEAGLARYTAA